MKTVILDPLPAGFDELIEQRRALGQDGRDEVWEGVYHMTPGPSGPHAYLEHELVRVLAPYARAAGLVSTGGFNLGAGPDDFRVPDSGFHRAIPAGVWQPTAVIAVEILSPGDESYEKFEFYGRHGVEEIFVVDAGTRSFEVWCRDHTHHYLQVAASDILQVTAAEVAGAIVWPDR